MNENSTNRMLVLGEHGKQEEVNQNCFWWIPETEVNVSVVCRNNGGPDLQQEVETLRREVAALRLQHHLVGVLATFSLNICALFVCTV